MENISSLNLITDAVEQAKAGNIRQSEALIAQALGTTILKITGSSTSEG